MAKWWKYGTVKRAKLTPRSRAALNWMTWQFFQEVDWSSWHASSPKCRSTMFRVWDHRQGTPALLLAYFHLINLQCVSRIWASITWLKFIIRRLKLISTTAPAASKNGCFKSGQNWLKNNHLKSWIQIRDTLCKKRETDNDFLITTFFC